MSCRQNKRQKFITSFVWQQNLLRDGAQNKHNINDSGRGIVLEKQQDIVMESSSTESESFSASFWFLSERIPTHLSTTTSGEEVWTIKLWQWFRGGWKVMNWSKWRIVCRRWWWWYINLCYVFIFYSRDERQSWITLELCIIVDGSDFSPQFFCCCFL